MKEINNEEDKNINLEYNNNFNNINLNNNNFIHENYKNKLYNFSEFHTLYNGNSHFHNINIPHYSFYPYSDSCYSLSDANRNNLLKEKSKLKQMCEFFKNELNRAKNENKIGNKYIQLLEDKIYIDNPKQNKFNHNISITPSGNKNFNYKEFKEKYNLLNQNINKYNTINSESPIFKDMDNNLIYSTQLLNNNYNTIDYLIDNSNDNINNKIKNWRSKNSITKNLLNNLNKINDFKIIKENEINIKNSVDKDQLVSPRFIKICSNKKETKNLADNIKQRIKDNTLKMKKKSNLSNRILIKKYQNNNKMKPKNRSKINKLFKKPKKISFKLDENINKSNSDLKRVENKNESYKQKVNYLKKNYNIIKKINRLFSKKDKKEKGKLTYNSALNRNLKKINVLDKISKQKNKENNYKTICFACEAGCSISTTGYSRMSYSPYNNMIRRRDFTPINY